MRVTLNRRTCQPPLEPRGARPRDARENFLRRLRLDVARSGKKMECAASEIGVDHSTVSHWRRGRHDLPAWRLPDWTAAYGPGLLSETAARCGFALVPAAAVRFAPGDFRALVRLFIEHSCAFAAASLDGESAIRLGGMRFVAQRIAAAIEAADEWRAA